MKHKQITFGKLVIFIMLILITWYLKNKVINKKSIPHKSNFFGNVLKRMKIRVDSKGDGHFGASRGDRWHQGIDLVCRPGENVFSPLEGNVIRVNYAYADDTNYFNIVIQNQDYLAKVMYVKPIVVVGQAVKLGQTIGTAQAINKKYGSAMLNHIHLEIWKNGQAIDPEKYFAYA